MGDSLWVVEEETPALLSILFFPFLNLYYESGLNVQKPLIHGQPYFINSQVIL